MANLCHILPEMPCFRTPMKPVLLGQDADTACSLDLSYVLCSFVMKVNVSLCSKIILLLQALIS